MTFSVPVSSTVMLGNVEYEAGGALLDDAGAAVVSFDFVLPKDYKPDSKIKVFFVFVTAPAACILKFEAGGYTRTRVGEMGGYDGDPTFLRPRGGPFVSVAHPWVGVRKVFILGSDGILSDRKPGDMIGLEMERYNSDAADTCGNVLLSGLRLSTR